MFNNIIIRYGNYLYFVFRLLVGLLFLQHGAQKLFGLFEGQAFALFSLMWFVGLIEFVGGLAIFLGFFTRLAAFGTAILTLIVYFKIHVPLGLVPIMNDGELALLYFAAFLVVIVNGAKKFSLEKLILKREVF